jgi:serine/threonine protein phosphatase 1
VPEGRRVYAVGEIHGRADLLLRLHELIATDAVRGPSAKPVVIYLGDYIDRGPQSRAVIDLLLERPLAGVEAVHLLGNHEQALLRFLDDTAIGPTWFDFGGIATLLSFGIAVTAGGLARAGSLSPVQGELRSVLAPSQLAFLRSLQLMHVEGGYAFVHAGIRPGVPLDRQTEKDLLNIRSEFLDSTLDHGKVIVHGHSIREEPEIRFNRIGIDTGAYATGRLTCLVLEGTSRDFLHT